MDLTKYLKLFISESQEHLQKMDHLLLELEKSPQERSLVDELFREAHSMKGMSASMGYAPISTLSHRLEDFLDRIRKRTLSVTKAAVDLLFEGFDLLRSSIEEVKEKGSALTDHSAFLRKLESFRDEEAGVKVAPSLSASAPEPPKPPSAPPLPLGEEEDAIRQAQRWAMERGLRLYSITVQVARDAAMPNARALVTCKRVGGLGEILTVSPTLEELQGGHFSGSLSMLLGTPKEGSEIQASILAQPEIASVTVQDLTSKEVAPPGRETAPPVSSAVPLQMRKSTMVRVDTRLLDDLVDMVGELVTVKGSLVDYLPRLSSLSLRDHIDRVDQLVSGLYQLAIRLRMMPLDFVAERFPRALRDLARLKGKEVTFEIKGKEIELDRAILEELPDPLLHIFRNCIDHGVESAEERVKKGKPPQGRVTMEAKRERERILITIRDDGKGMEPARIRRVALEKGIISREQLGSLSDEESLYLITAPGFSTAEIVSDVSGRGVGMDVVKSVIESLGGTLLIESKKDEGTAITLKLPLTLAIIQVLLVKVGEERYAIPLSQIYRTFEASPAEIQTSQGQEWIAGEEGLIPLLRLSSLLGISDGRGGGSKRSLVVILVDRRGRTTGMVVDQLLGYREAVVKPLRGILRKIKGFAGATVLGDGSLILILDLNTL
ncbi:MAG: chemotaxis protein CheA [candidate division NC10 bacterium]|nr:chemotaxis protein CheA [candidate division NC10 bacterium]